MIRYRNVFASRADNTVVEVIGYGGRAASHNSTDKLGPYIVQSIMLLVAPALFAASVYMTLGRIIRSVEGEKYSLVKPTLLTKIFVAGDVLSFLVQGGGAGIMASGDSEKTAVGEKIIIGGLIIQIVIFGIFWTVAAMFHHRISMFPTTASNITTVPWRRCLWILYAISALIMVRSIFRVIEYAGGHDGYLLSYEWPLYVFDSTLMLFVTIIFDIRNYEAARIHNDPINI